MIITYNNNLKMPFTLGSPNGGRVHIPQGAGVMPPELVFK